MVLADSAQAIEERRIVCMITITVENVGQCHDPAVRCHSRKQFLIFGADSVFIIATDLVEQFAAKHCRAMRKWNVTRTTHDSPAVSRTHFTTRRINSIAKRADHSKLGTVLKDVPLPSQSIRMSNVVGVHARDNGSTRLRNDGV